VYRAQHVNWLGSDGKPEMTTNVHKYRVLQILRVFGAYMCTVVIGCLEWMDEKCIILHSEINN